MFQAERLACAKATRLEKEWYTGELKGEWSECKVYKGVGARVEGEDGI